MRFHQLAPERAVGRALMCIKDRQCEGEREKDTRQPCRELHQNVRGLRAKNVFRDPAAKGRAEAFALRTLHQDYEHHEQRHEHVNDQEQIDEQVHRDGEYHQRGNRSKRPTFNIEFRKLQRWAFA